MTFKNFENLFKGKYPDGTVFAHDVFEHGVPGRIQKVAIVFENGGKVYKYRGAYEDILCRIGINVISKERFNSLSETLSRMIETDGAQDEFFGGTIDNSAEIARLSAEVERYRRDYIIV
jgi:hypothetical protein